MIWGVNSVGSYIIIAFQPKGEVVQMSGTTQYNNPLLQGKTYDDAKWNTVLPVPYGMTAWGSV